MEMNSQKKDRKSLPLSGYSVILPFIATLGFFPVWLVVMVPLALISIAVKSISSLFRHNKSKNSAAAEASEPSSIDEILKSNSYPENLSSNIDKRPYDLILFGATGFTGRLAALYLAKQYGLRDFSWTIAGRRKDALQTLKNELVRIDASLEQMNPVIADSFDDASLASMVSSTKVIITTAGPFRKYGSSLVKYCAAYGTHYCDTTGETDWVREMIDKYDDVAKKTGARIVHFCGHDCIPWDLTVLECARQLRRNGDQICEVNVYDEIRFEASGGTLETLFASIDNRTKLKTNLGFDPLVKSSMGSKSPNTFIINNVNGLRYSKEHKMWTGPFVMAMVMANCIRRSNALNNYSGKLVYREGLVYPSLLAAVTSSLSTLYYGTGLFTPPLRSLMYALKILPKPGEGPSKESMDKGTIHERMKHEYDG